MRLIHFATELQQSKILFIISFTVPTFQLGKVTFSIVLTDQLLYKMKSKIFQHFLSDNSTYLFNNNKSVLYPSIKYILEERQTIFLDKIVMVNA